MSHRQPDWLPIHFVSDMLPSMPSIRTISLACPTNGYQPAVMLGARFQLVLPMWFWDCSVTIAMWPSATRLKRRDTLNTWFGRLYKVTKTIPFILVSNWIVELNTVEDRLAAQVGQPSATSENAPMEAPLNVPWVSGIAVNGLNGTIRRNGYSIRITYVRNMAQNVHCHHSKNQDNSQQMAHLLALFDTRAWCEHDNTDQPKCTTKIGLRTRSPNWRHDLYSPIISKRMKSIWNHVATNLMPCTIGILQSMQNRPRCWQQPIIWSHSWILVTSGELWGKECCCSFENVTEPISLYTYDADLDDPSNASADVTVSSTFERTHGTPPSPIARETSARETAHVCPVMKMPIFMEQLRRWLLQTLLNIVLKTICKLM